MYPFNVGIVISSPDLWDEVQSSLQSLPVRVAFEIAALESVGLLVDKVERYRPEVVLLDAAALGDALTDVLFQLKRTAAAPKLVVLSKSSAPDSIMAAVRAGAHEYLYPPIGVALKDALERMSGDFDRTKGQREETAGGRNFGFLSAKGGCGATTLACHAAVEIQARTGKETVLADLDLGSGLIRFLMQCKTRYSVVDAMEGIQRLDRSYWASLVSNGRPGLEIIAAPLENAAKELHRAHDIRHVLRFMRSQYAWVIADLGHGLEPLTWSALPELDELLLVSTLDVPSLHRAKVIARQLLDGGFSRDKLRFVLNRVPRKTDVGIADIEQVLGLKIYETVPNDYRALEEAWAEGRLLNGEHPVRQRIGRLASKLAGLTQGTPRRKFALFG